MPRLPANWLTPTPGSWLERRLRKRSPQEFLLGARVVRGRVPDEGRRWSYRWTFVESADGYLVVLNHGSAACQLRLQFTGERRAAERGGGLRPGHAVWPAVEVQTGADMEIALDPAGALDRLGLD